MQHTVSSTIPLNGVGLHSGADISMKIHPARPDHGIAFIRRDVKDRYNRISAVWNRVVDTQLCTVVGNDAGVTVGTIEHLMAALRGCGVDNAVIELDGPEVPVMDGSAETFVQAIDCAGLYVQSKPRRAIKILKEVSIEDGDKKVSLKPAISSSFIGKIDFDHPAIGKQEYKIELMNGAFRYEVAEARTFGFIDEVHELRKRNLAQGASFDNAVVLDNKRILNKEGLRFNRNEFVRHKILDAIGDLYLAGGPILGTYEGVKMSHDLNNRLLRKLFATKDAWTYIDLFVDIDGVDSITPIMTDERPAVLSISL